MSKSLNAALIAELSNELEDVDSCVVVGTSAMNVAEVSEFRTKLRGQAFRMRVVKNSLAKLAFERVGMAGLEAVLDGPSAVIHGGEGCLAISKIVAEEKRTAKDKLQIHGGFNEGDVETDRLRLKATQWAQPAIGVTSQGLLGVTPLLGTNMVTPLLATNMMSSMFPVYL